MPGPTSTTPPTASTTHPRRWFALALLGVAQLMLILDVTVVAIALPQMGTDLGLGREVLTWVVSAYTLTFGGLLLLGGRLADLVGPRALVLAGLVVFTAGSLVAGLSVDATTLLGGRVAQGLGAAMLSPAGLSAVVRIFDGEERNRALGIWSSLGGVGAALGVLLGGLLTGGPGWPWVFFVNVPVGAVVLVLLLSVLPPLPTPEAGRLRLDVLGAVLVTAATGVLIYAVVGAGDRGWLSARTLLLVVASVALYAAFVVRQHRASSPLLDLAVLRRRAVASGVLVILVATALMVGVFFLGTFYLQDVAGHGAVIAGLLFLPVALATMVGANVAGSLVGRLGSRALGVVGTLVAAAGLAVPALAEGTTALVLGLAVGSAGIGSMFVVAAATALGQVEPHLAGLVSGIVSTGHEVGASVGAAVVSSVAAASILAGTTIGFERAFAVSAGVALVTAGVVAVAVPPRPRVSS